MQNLLEMLRASAQLLKNAGLASGFPAKLEILQLPCWTVLDFYLVEVVGVEPTSKKREMEAHPQAWTALRSASTGIKRPTLFKALSPGFKRR